MKSRFPLFVVLFLILVGQGCKTTSGRMSSVKKTKMPPMVNESYALMDEGENIDKEILQRGNKARGLSEY